MCRVKVIETRDRQMWWWEVIDEKNPEIIELVTWKGIYVVDNKKPEPPKGLKIKRSCAQLAQDFSHFFRVYCGYVEISSVGFVYAPNIPGKEEIVWKYCHAFENQKRFDWCTLYFNPLTQTWGGRGNVMNKLCKWAMKQPPQPDLEGAQKDRQEVEKLFTEIDKQCTVE